MSGNARDFMQNVYPTPTELVQSLPAIVPFVGPERQERARGRPFRARIGANESGFGPAPSVIEAMRQAAPDVWKYGDPDNFDLKTAIGAHLGLGADNVAIGEGIDGLLGLLVRMYAAQGDAIVTSLGGYPTFNFHAVGFGARLVTVPYQDSREDLAGLLEAAKREQAKIVYLANPDNPMGTWWDAKAIMQFAEALPETTLLALDEAYGETAPADAIPPTGWQRANVIRFRTFSKAYGLAGLRLGYAFGAQEAIAQFDKVRNHFGISRIAQAAGLAALADQTYLSEVVTKIATAREHIATIARENGLAPIPSATNFVAVDCGRDGQFALKVLQNLIQRDVFVRKPMAPGLDHCIRISAGLEPEMDLLAEALPEALAEADC